MNKKPVWVLTGLAVAAVAVVGGLTKDRWMGGPQTVANIEATVPVPSAPETPAAAPQAAPEAAPSQQAAAPEPAPQPETPAAAQETPQVAAESAPQVAAEAAPQPAAPEPAQEQQVAVAEPAPAETTAEGQAPSAGQEAAAQPEPAAVPEQPAAPEAAAQPEPPAQPETAEAPASTEAQPDTAAAEPAPATPAPAEEASTAEAGKTDQAAAPEVPSQAAPAEPAAAPEQPEQVPAFDTVRVEKTGEAVIAGTAEAGAEVVVKLDGEEIGRTIANDGGAFVVVPDEPLPEGSGALTIEAKGEGDAEATVSEQVVAVIVPAQAARQDALVAVVSPGEPTRVLQSPSAAEPEPEAAQPAAEEKVAPVTPEPEAPATPKPAAAKPRMVSLDAVDYDETGNIVFSGRGEPGLGARIYVDNGHLGDAGVGENGRWQFSGTANIAPGVHSLRVDGVDASGRVMNRIEVPFFREEGRKVAAAAGSTETPSVGLETSEGKQDAAAAEPPAGGADEAATTPGDGRVVIQPGNNLWRISKVLYGTGTKFTVLYEANKDQIRNPDLIYPGQVFMTPDVVPPAETIDPSLREPLVPAGDAAAQ